MAKGTILFLFALSVISTLLFGINIGKKIEKNPNPIILTPTNIPQITLPPQMPSLSPPFSIKEENGQSTYTDKACGFSFTLESSYIKSESKNSQTVIYGNPDNPLDKIQIVCLETIPVPEIDEINTEEISVAGKSTLLYFDQDEDGNPRKIVVLRNEAKSKDILIAGYGPSFDQAIQTLIFE